MANPKIDIATVVDGTSSCMLLSLFAQGRLELTEAEYDLLFDNVTTLLERASNLEYKLKARSRVENDEAPWSEPEGSED